MPEWIVEYQTHDWETVAKFDPLKLSINFKLAEPGTFTNEIALSDPLLTRDLIGPKRNDVRLWRDNNPVFDGELREVSLEFERDTLLCNHSTYMEYLNDRVYPFHYPWTAGEWPKQWRARDLTTIALDIIQAMIDDDEYVPPFRISGSLTGITQNYEIDTADSTKILEHLKTLGDRDDGFDIRINRSGDYVDIVLLHPRALEEEPIYTITKDIGQITKFDWINKGPDGTFTTGLGAGYPNKSNAAQFQHTASRAKFRRRDNWVDFGRVRSLAALQKLTAAENHRALFPQKELELAILVDVAHLPNFWSRNHNRPESLLGKSIWVGPIKFYNYHTIDAEFKILDMTIEPDDDGNEFVSFGLEMIDG